ncbi:MAG: hypothetical protein Alis3KO_27850 [Aliiglaciecola sp.]|uniref:hypothetical protein n=1 Tax=Aliiglaciecola sp. M165 TaxID=2593649 RepID=UPI00117E5A2F|nr:hypothetical protein [Aliiglaciecola sp. M165]TRY30588.1 hypothetical protein FM019_11870 [Aliiglaciecola sp. M165]
MKYLIFLTTLMMLGGCSTMAGKNLLGNAAGEASNTQVGYGRQCFAVKSQCAQGIYEEWETSDGVEGCSCKKL